MHRLKQNNRDSLRVLTNSHTERGLGNEHLRLRVLRYKLNLELELASNCVLGRYMHQQKLRNHV